MHGKLYSFTIVIFIFIGGMGWQILETVEQPYTVATEYATCTQPTTTNAEICAAQEAQILASVVRIVLHADFQKGQLTDFRGNVGHATVMAGRYLITHNHFSIDLSALSPANHQEVTGFSLYNAAGQRIVHNAPASTFQVAAQDSETLVLDFGPDYFNNLNMTSASFMTAKDAKLSVGAEVAQLDWDGERAFVVWTTVAQVVTHHESPHLELDHYAMVGASGGGVFWQGYHVANNWAHVTITDPVSGTFRRAYSLAALNSENILIDVDYSSSSAAPSDLRVAFWASVRPVTPVMFILS
jgi:hypothetical protein